MSHITDVKLKIKDLDALAEAAEALGLELVRGQKTHAWYGRFMNDSEEGRRVVAERGLRNLGKCDHALRLKARYSGDYEIGVVAEADGGYSLLYDSWGPGQRLERAAGPQLTALRREYAASVATAKAKATLGRQGWTVRRENLSGNRIRLKVVKR